MSSKPSVVIIIVNWNATHHTVECLQSLGELTYECFDVVVVDNGSTDDSVQRIGEWAASHSGNATPFSQFISVPEGNAEAGHAMAQRPQQAALESRRLVLISHGENAGFSAGNNVGIRWARQQGADFVLLLNNDTIVAPDFLTEMIGITARHPNVGIIGAKMYYYDAPDKIWYAGGDLQKLRAVASLPGYGEKDDGRFDVERRVSFVTGACMMIGSRLLEQCGLLDEDFFLGGEDYIYCVCAVRGGFTLWYAPAAQVWHKVGQTRKVEAQRLYAGYRAQTLFMKKRMAAVVFWPWAITYAVAVSLVAPRRMKGSGIPARLIRAAVWRGVLDGAGAAPIRRDDLSGPSSS